MFDVFDSYVSCNLTCDEKLFDKIHIWVSFLFHIQSSDGERVIWDTCTTYYNYNIDIGYHLKQIIIKLV